MANAMVHLRVKKEILLALDNFIKNGFYNSRTEFINEAVRKKIEEEQLKQTALENLKKNRGILKGKIKRLSKEEMTKRLEQSLAKESSSDILRKFGLE
ncbi:MAG: ribbon-helix-helix domain-containing protein [Candidatus Diapherotrites archaeon]|nr:ribbon-helix-helix domain-containing protein [Candidatus Diapherotrites archaeon]